MADGARVRPDYQWVAPPAGVTGNVVPAPLIVPLPVGEGGSASLSVTTPDGQCALYLPAGTVPRGRGEDAVVRVDPRDAAALAPLPGGFGPNGNAYAVQLTAFDGSPIATWDRAGSMVLVAPRAGGTVHELRNGRWVRIGAGPDGPESRGRFRIAGNGTYAVLETAPDGRAASPRAGRWPSVLGWGAGLGLAAAAAWAIRQGLSRGRAPSDSAGRRPRWRRRVR